MALDFQTIGKLRRIAPTIGMSDETRAALDTIYNYALDQRTPEQQQPVNSEPMPDALPGVNLGHVDQYDENPDAFNWQLQQVEARIQAVATRDCQQLSQHQQPFQQPRMNQQPLMNQQLRNQSPSLHNRQPQDPWAFSHEGPNRLSYNRLFVQHPMPRQPMQQQTLMNHQTLDQPPLPPWFHQSPGYSGSSLLPNDRLFLQKPMYQQAMSQQPVQQHHYACLPLGPGLEDCRQPHLQPQSCVRVPMLQLYQPKTLLHHQSQKQASHAEQLEAQQRIHRILDSQPLLRSSRPQLSQPQRPHQQQTQHQSRHGEQLGDQERITQHEPEEFNPFLHRRSF